MKSPKNKVIIIHIEGNEVQINNEIKGAWYKMINDTRNLARRNHTCGQANYRLCCGDCPLCPWQLQGNILSINESPLGNCTEMDILPGESIPADTAPGPAEIVETSDTIQRILKYASSICEDGDLILAMCIEGLPSQKIAIRMGIPRRTMDYRIKKIQKEVRKYYIEFFM